jgi:hypothetical protein
MSTPALPLVQVYADQNPPYSTNEIAVGNIDLAALHLIIDPADCATLIGLLEAAALKAGVKLTLTTVEQGVGKFSYYLLPGDPRKPLALYDQNGNVVADFAGEMWFQIFDSSLPNATGYWKYAPETASTDKNDVFQWVWNAPA